MLTVVKPEHGTVVGPGIRCGSFGDDCSSEHPLGTEITLKAYADDNYRAAGFTGDCKKNGDTVMTGARRCAATFNQSQVAASGPSGGGDPGLTPRGTTSSRPPPPPAPNTPDPIDGRVSADPPTPRRDPDGEGKPSPPVVARPTAESIAKDDIKKLLAEYREAYERLDPEGVKRLYPTVSVSGLRTAFRDVKSLEYTYTGEPEFVDLNPALGTATVKAPARFSPTYKGPKTPPQNLINTFELSRFDGTWTIRSLKVAQK